MKAKIQDHLLPELRDFSGKPIVDRTKQNVFGHLNGLIGWLEDVKKAVNYGSFKIALDGMKNVKKELPKAIKEIEKYKKEMINR